MPDPTPANPTVPARQRLAWGEGTMHSCSTTLHLANLQVTMPPKGILVEQYAGDLTLENVATSNGCLLWSHGGTTVRLRKVTSSGVPFKYWLCNFGHALNWLELDNSGLSGDPWIRQGPYEACVRLMQVEHASIVGLRVMGSGYKQAVQDRGDGTEAGTGEHVWRDCQISGEVDIGYMTDPAIPIRPLGVSRWINCIIDKYSVRAGVKKVVLENCLIGAKWNGKTWVGGQRVTRTITQ